MFDYKNGFFFNPHEDREKARHASVLLGADENNHRSLPAWAEVIAAAKEMKLPGSECWEGVQPYCIFHRLTKDKQRILFEVSRQCLIKHWELIDRKGSRS